MKQSLAQPKTELTNSRLPDCIRDATQVILGGTSAEGFWGFGFNEFAEYMHDGLCRLVVDPSNTRWGGRILWTQADVIALENAKRGLDMVPSPAHRCDLKTALAVASNNQIVAISGPIESGKTTAAIALERAGFEHLAFADTFKVAWAMIFGIPVRYFNDHELKKAPLPGSRLTPRAIMQLAATEVCREFYDQLWVHRLALRMAAIAMATRSEPIVLARNLRVAVGDLRFQNEADFLRMVDATILRISRPEKVAGDSGAVVQQHLSEMGFSNAPGDVHLRNDSTVENFSALVISTVDRRSHSRSGVRLISPRLGR